MQVKTRLMLGGLVAFLGLLAIAVMALLLEKSTMMDDKKLKTRHLVESAHTLLVHFHELEKSGAMTGPDAQPLRWRPFRLCAMSKKSISG